MKLIGRVIVLFIAHAIGLWVADYFIGGFKITESLAALAQLAGVLTLLYLIVRPIIKLVMTPVLIITLGLGIIIVNAVVLFLLDAVMENLTITGLLPLFYATVLISLVTVIVTIFAKPFKKKD